MLNDYIPYTSIVASKVTTRCKLGGCYDDGSSFAPCPVSREPRVRAPSTVIRVVLEHHHVSFMAYGLCSYEKKIMID